jgi:hypothetical protein
MIQITVDAVTGSQFRDAYEPAQVCDEEGRVLGYFTPTADPSMYESVEPPSSDEELLRRANAGGGRTWREIKADLEQRP